MNLRKYIPFIILLLTLGCEKDDEKTEPVYENPLKIVFGETKNGDFGEIIYQDKTVVLNNQLKTNLIEVNQNYLVFNYSSSFELLSQSDVLFSNETELAPNGFARKISSIEKNENTIKFMTTQAKAEDIFEEAQIQQSFLPNYLDIQNLIELENNQTNKNSSFKKEINSTPLTQLQLDSEDGRTNLTFKIDLGDNDLNTEYDQIKITGFIEYEHSVPPYVDYKYNRLFPFYSYFHINGMTKIKKGIEITYGGKTEEDFIPNDFIDLTNTKNTLERDYRLFSIPFTATSPTNLIIQPKLVVFARLNLNLEGKLSIQFIKEFDFAYSADWNIQNSNGIWQHSFQKVNESPWHFNSQISAELNLEITPIGIAPIVDFPQFLLTNNNKSYIGFFIHPYSRKLTANANYNTSSNCFKFNLSQQNSFKVTLEADITPLFSGFNVDIDNTIYSTPWTNENNIYEYEKCFTNNNSKPTVTTNSITNVTETSASSGGNVTNDGGSNVTARGICWSIGQNPNTNDNITNNGTRTGTFTSALVNLNPNTTYYVRAYATNGEGTTYGNQQSFTTNSKNNSAPTVTTSSTTNITETSASSGGNVTNDGGSNAAARGICWSTNPNPDINNNTTSNGTGRGNFSSSITGLNANTAYYVKAYATNSVGITYGNQQTFKTNNNTSSISLVGDLNFTDTEVNSTSQKTFTIKNTGNKSFNVSSISFPNNVYSANWDSGTINANDSQNIIVTFQPINAISYNGTITVNNNAENGTYTMPISGNGTNGNTGNSDIRINNITFDDEGDGEYDINVDFINIGNEETPNNETINIEYFVNGNSIGTDTHSNMSPNEDRTEYYNNYEFPYEGTHNVEVKISQISNEIVTSNNSKTVSFNNNSNSTISITPADKCNSSPIMEVNTEYQVNIDVGNYDLFDPIEGESDGGEDVRGFWLEMNIPNNWSGIHNVIIYDVSSNFDPVIGIKTICNNAFYLYQPNTDLRFANLKGNGNGETFKFNAKASNNFYVRIYHYYGNETPEISFKIKVE